jgi:hypothetical protein
MSAMRTVIRTRLNTGSWTTVPIQWDGFNLNEGTPVPSAAYFRPRIDEGEDLDVGVGGNPRRRRWVCTLVVDYSAPVGIGDATASDDLDDLLDRFDRFELSGVVFHRPGYVKDMQSDGVRHLWRAFLPFYYERTV